MSLRPRVLDSVHSLSPAVSQRLLSLGLTAWVCLIIALAGALPRLVTGDGPSPSNLRDARAQHLGR